MTEAMEAAEMKAEVDKEAAISDLLKRGYVEVSEINNLKAGARVRHTSQCWPGVYSKGTATIEHIFHNPKSSWSQKYSRQDIELIVKKDKTDFASGYGYWTDYNTDLVYEQPVERVEE